VLRRGGRAVTATAPEIAIAAKTACTHCGLPVPAALMTPGEPLQFCCGGCRTVYALLHENGLERYYDLRERFVDERPEAARGAVRKERGYAAFDDPTFHALHVRRARPDGPACVDLALEGVHCVACVWLLERVPRLAPGVTSVEVDRGRSVARVTFDPARRPLSEIAALVDSLGYPVHPFRGTKLLEARRREDRALLVRVGASGAAAGNVMLLAAALYSGLFGDMSAGEERYFRWLSLAITVPSVLFAGSIFFRGAWASLRTRVLHLDLPIAIGLLAGLLWGAFNTVVNRGEVYFDSLAVLTFLLLTGRYLAQKGRRRAVDATELLYSLAPSVARLVEADGRLRDVPVEALAPGAVVEVRPGEPVPADGVVLEGTSALDQAFLTGESRPVPCAPGDLAPAGALNQDAPLRFRVERTGEETRVGRLMRQVDDLARRRAPILLWVDRISGRFVAGVLTLAAASFAWWALARGEPGTGLECALAILVVTCPCALGMATPLAIHAALGRAARRGIYVRGGDVVQALGAARGGRIWLDKTGTLTEGRARLVSRRGDAGLLALAAALEARSSHPLARALLRSVEGPARQFVDDPTLEVAQVRETRGGGVEGSVLGRALVVGAPAFVRARAALSPRAEADLAAVLAAGETPVLVAVEGRVALVLGFGDALRPEAKETVAALQARGFAVGLLSGDDPAVVARVAAEVGIAAADAIGAATPERKAEVVAASRASGGGAPEGRPVIMIGDGVNDAPAFAAASVGIAVHGAAEAGLAAADAFLCRPGLGALLELVDGARATMRVVRRNLLLSLGYNAIGASLAAAGLLHPLVGAVLMPFSSLSVVGSSYRARTFAAPDATPPAPPATGSQGGASWK